MQRTQELGMDTAYLLQIASDHSNQTLKQQNIIQTPFPSVEPKTHKTPLS